MSAQDATLRVSEPGRRGMGPRIASRLGNVAVSWSLVLVLLVVWQIAAERGGSLFFPPPLEIIQRAQELWLSGPASNLFLTDSVFDDVIPSLTRMLAGWALAVAVGITAGMLVGRSKLISDLSNPALQFLRSIPAPAIIPVFVVLLGTGTTMRIFLIAFGSIWPVLINTADGARTIDSQQLDAARAFGIPRAARIRRVLLPAALPKILTGMRISVSLALILMVVSELVAATNGIGYQMAQAQATFLLTDMWAGILLLALLGLALNKIFAVWERRMTVWYRGVQRGETT